MTRTRGSMRWRRSMPLSMTLGLSVLALSLCGGPRASAQTRDELEKARTLFKEGVALSAANNCAAALTKYRAVANVKMTAQVAFNIAECEERLGKLVSALGNYRVAAVQAEGDAKSKDVSSRVGARIDALEPRIPRLIIKRGKGADTALIELDGSELGASQLSAEIPVDPGSHTVVAKIGDKAYLHETILLEEKAARTFEVQLDLPPPKIEKPVIEAPPPPPPPPPPQGRSKIPGAVLLGVGVASAAVGVGFIVLRGGTLSELDKKCGGDTSCPPSAAPLADQGKLYTGLAEATFAVGVVGVITGVVLLATSGPSAPPKAAQRLGPSRAASRRVEILPASIGASIGGISLIGRF